MNNRNKQQLKKFIYETDFAVDETILYLDTHPCDQQALAFYNNYRQMLEKARKEYARCYGPLENDNVNVDNYWTWIEEPWPWEGECE